MRAWLLPPLAAAAAVLVGLLLIPHERGGGRREAVFVLRAPQATRVELVGDFTDWHRGRLPMRGPDADGRWTARVRLPAGRYEYLFLVEDEQWVSDPLAITHRPDGFGHQNAVVNL
jgi:1,4-alpha-glucan branching enzyme